MFRVTRLSSSGISSFESPFSASRPVKRVLISPFRALRTQLSCHRHQLPSRHPQVRQREQRDHMRRVFCQTAEADLQQAELPLDHLGTGCSTFARTLALRCSCFCPRAPARASPSLPWPERDHACDRHVLLALASACQLQCSQRPRAPCTSSPCSSSSASPRPTRWPAWRPRCAPAHCRRRRRCAPSCRSTTDCPSSSDAYRGRARPPRSWSNSAPQ